MFTKEDFNNCNAWPFIEARRILEKVEYKTPKKGYILLETGYGPSGLPHIGTFGEVVRTNFVRLALQKLAPEIPVKILVVSDDFDAMRKVPDTIPNPEEYRKYHGVPLTSIPDPFKEEESYGHYMNKRLNNFLHDFGFEYDFLSATEAYRNGIFNEYLVKAAEKFDDLMKIMLPTLGEERQATYCPFLPVKQDTGEMLIEFEFVSIDPKNGTIKYKDKSGEVIEQSFLNGGCKLQWKCDFGMRWAALDVDYEIYGKDHYPNEPIYRKICETLGKEPPVNYFYELFLDAEGKKISKSKGNGISVEEWVRYSIHDSLSLFMYQKPKTAKKLYFECIPKATDEYLSFLSKYKTSPNLDSPVFFIHEEGKFPKDDVLEELSFSMLLNLASACQAEDADTMWKFVGQYSPNAKGNKIYEKLVQGAVNYYHDFIKPHLNFKTPNEKDIEILSRICEALTFTEFTNSTDVQNVIYNVAHNLEVDTKELFQCFYQCILGATRGPRLGSFFFIYGKENSIKLIHDKIV